MAVVDLTVHGAGSVASMGEHLTGPLQAGAVETPVPIDATGTAPVAWATREPLLLAAPARDLGPAALAVAITVPGSAVPVELRFAPYTERGAQLPVLRPATGASGVAAPFSVMVAVTEQAPDGTATAVPAAGVAAWLELRVLEGILGRVLYVLAAEKARQRRLAHEVAAMRRLGLARNDALDRIGAEVGVPRFADTLAYEQQQVVTKPAREADADYARRLRLYRPWRVPGRRRALELLNGPGPGPANTGPLGQLGLADRFTLVEADDPIAVAVRVVGAEDPLHRQRFLEYVREVHLVWPRAGGASAAVHTRRMRTEAARQRDSDLRKAVRDTFGLPAGDPPPALAPLLAAALARVGRVRAALGETAPWTLTRAQADAGSRYELGLGADLAPPAAAELDRMVAAHATRVRSGDAELDALLSAMRPRRAAADPEGRWLLGGCGLQTVHRVDAATLYVSHLPVSGLAVTGPSQVTPAGWSSLVTLDLGARDVVLFYERSTGTAEMRTTTADGKATMSLLRSHTGWRSTWTHIVAGRFGAQAAPGLLFYDRAAGHGELYAVDEQGVLTVLRSLPGLGKTWTHVLAGRFTAAARSGLVMYDRSAGALEVHAGAADGKLTRLRTHADMGGSWTHLVPVQPTTGPLTGLLAYEAGTGTAHVYASDGVGGLRLLRRHADLPAGWTHVVAGTSDSERVVMGYDRTAGTMDTYILGADGALDFVLRRPFKPTYTQLTTAQLSRTERPELIAYDRAGGKLDTYGFRHGELGYARVKPATRKSSGQLYEARYHAPGDPGSHVVLVGGLQAADAAWRAAPHNGPAWTVLTDAQAGAAWTAAAAPAAAVLDTFRAAGLPGVAALPRVLDALRRLPAELVETIQLSGTQSAEILAAQPGAAVRLEALAGVLEAAGIASALPLVSGGSVILVVGAIGLPEAGVNLSDRRASGFRWYVVPIQGLAGSVGAVGSRTAFTPAEAGVSALVVLGYARGAGTDPYEFRVDLPPSGRLTLTQYEYLMNVLEQAHAAGVEVNTHGIRKQHVDLAGGGVAEPLTPAIARTFRAFHRPRLRGEPPEPPEPEEP